MSAVRSLAAAAIRRRRVQGTIISFVLLLATLASTIALEVLNGSRSPFDAAFANANGAHLVLTFDGATDAASLAATGTVGGVTAASGPTHVAQAGLVVDQAGAAKGGAVSFTPAAISDRDGHEALVDQLTLLSGRWWQAPGEVVLSRTEANLAGPGHRNVGDAIDLTQLVGPGAAGSAQSGTPKTVTLRIVGIAASISTPDVGAWMSPSDLDSFVPAGSTAAEVMLYRASDPTSQASLTAVRDAIAATLPGGAVTGTRTWLALRTGADEIANLMVPILLAFAAFAFLAAAFIVVNVVSGVVVGSLRQIGLMKALGATPRNVTVVLVAEVALPAMLGAVVGTGLGALASGPILASSAEALGVPTLELVSPIILVGVMAAAAIVAVLAALGPAVRGARLSTVEALTRGQAPGSAGRRLGFRFPAWLPDSAALGLRRLGARPLRTLMTLGALTVGVAAITFSLGMETSLATVGAALFRNQAAPVRIDIPDVGTGPSLAGEKSGPSGPAPYTPEQIDALIAAQTATARYIAIGEADVAVPGLANPVTYFAYRGDSSWLGYVQIEGRWFSAPGEVDVPDNFLTQTGLHVGDSFSATFDGQPLALTIVGSIIDNERGSGDEPTNILIRGDWAALAAVDATLEPTQWEVSTNELMSPAAYVQSIRDQTNGFADAYSPSSVTTDRGFLLFESVIAMLGAILVLVSLGGVANTVLLEARERLRETAILRALGMTPRQVVAMIVASVVPLGVIAALMGIPIGIVLQHVTIETMARTALSSSLPSVITDALGPWDFVLLSLAGLAIALVGAWLPARRSSSIEIAGVLAAE